MSRPVSAGTGTEIAKAITAPLFLVELGFNVPVRYSSREQITWSSLLWQPASFKLRMSGQWSVELFNDSFVIGQTVLTQGTSGRTARVYQLYGAGPSWADADGECLLDGEMGEATITGSTVSITLKRSAPQRTPRIYLNPPLCNHIPPAGTQIRTASGTVILERG